MAFLRMPRGKDEPKTLGEPGAKPFRGGEENRAKDAKDAKVKGMEDGELGIGTLLCFSTLCDVENFFKKRIFSLASP